MNNEEKILEMLTQMQVDISGLKDSQAKMHEDISKMHEDISGMHEDISGMHEDISGMQRDISGMQRDISGMHEDISGMQKTVTRVAVTQENIVLKSLDALAEGQDLTHQRLKHLAGEDELSDLREEVRLLRTVVAQHSRDIEAIKAAQ